MDKIFQRTIILLFIGIGIFFALGVNADTFGYDPEGTPESYTSGDNDELHGSLFTSPLDIETAISITAYIDDTGSSSYFKGIIVLHSSLEIIDNGITPHNVVGTGAARWATTEPFGTPPSISPSTGYVLSVIFGINLFKVYYDTGGTDQGHYDDSNSESSPTDPTDAVHEDRLYSIYATYTPAAAARNRLMIIQ